MTIKLPPLPEDEIRLRGFALGLAMQLAEAKARIAELESELERERMRLVACGVIANANTPESAAKARDMHPDYWSASAADVARAVDAEIAARSAK